MRTRETRSACAHTVVAGHLHAGKNRYCRRARIANPRTETLMTNLRVAVTVRPRTTSSHSHRSALLAPSRSVCPPSPSVSVRRTGSTNNNISSRMGFSPFLSRRRHDAVVATTTAANRLRYRQPRQQQRRQRAYVFCVVVEPVDRPAHPSALFYSTVYRWHR